MIPKSNSKLINICICAVVVVVAKIHLYTTHIHTYLYHIYTYIICAYKRLQIFRLMSISVMFSIFLLINEVFILQSLANVYYIYKHPCKRGCMSFIEGFFNCYYIVANAYNCQSLAICTNQQRTERERIQCNYLLYIYCLLFRQ